MKTMYGIKQKYNLKDYVKYYKSRNGNGVLSNEQFGYINSIEYSVTLKGEVELTYVISDFIGCSSGYCVPQKAIIKKVKPKVPNFGYREYLLANIKRNECIIKNSQEEIKNDMKKLGDFDNE